MSSGWTEISGGRFVDPLNMNPDDIRIEDIAHSLSRQCRFSGYTRRHYSVAEHSMLVMDRVRIALGEKAETPEGKLIMLQALLHDATEAYMVDLPTPLKDAFPEYRAAEARLWKVVAEKFGLPEMMDARVKKADARMCSTEKLALLSTSIDNEKWGGWFDKYPAYVGAETWIVFREDYGPTPEDIQGLFLQNYYTMIGQPILKLSA